MKNSRLKNKCDPFTCTPTMKNKLRQSKKAISKVFDIALDYGLDLPILVDIHIYSQNFEYIYQAETN